MGRLRNIGRIRAGSTVVTPGSLFGAADHGGDFTLLTPSTSYSDTAGTTAAPVNTQVAAIRSRAGDIAIVTQSTAGARPYLRGTPTGPNVMAALGNFQAPADWTPGAGWSISGTRGVGVTTSAQLTPVSSPLATSGKYYLVRYYVTCTAGQVALVWGGVTGTLRAATGMYEEFMLATTSTGAQFVAAGFSGDVSQIQIYAADAADVSAPYFLDMMYNGAENFFIASNTITAYPATFISKGRRKSEAGNAGWVALYQSNVDTKWMDSAQLVDNKEAAVSIAEPKNIGNIDHVLIGEYAPNITARADMINSSPVVNANTWGTKTSLVFGYANPGTYDVKGRWYGGMVISRLLTENEKTLVERYLKADLSAIAWGNSLVSGTGSAGTEFSWTQRLSRVQNHYISNKGVGGETSAQIRTRFEADTSNTKSWVNLFQMVENDDFVTNGWGPTQTNILACTAAVAGNARYLVLGGTIGTGSTTITKASLTTLDTWMATTFGNRFVDVRAYLMTKGDGSANDNADIAAGLVPRSLRFDNIHWTDAGYQYATDLIYSRMQSLGWV